MTVTIIFIIAICVAAAIGAVIGIFKKATGLSFWGVTVLLGTLTAYLLTLIVKQDSPAYSYLILGITVGVVVLLVLFFGLIKKLLNRRITKAKEYSHYQNRDKLEENDAYMMNAVDNHDKHSYKTYRKKGKKIKDKTGGWGVFNRILGAFVGGVDWLVAVGSVICVLLLFIEFCGIGALQDYSVVQELLASDGWVNIGAKVALDMLLIGVLVIVIKAGFKSGIFRMITLLVVLAMLAGFGYASWAIASSGACAGIVTSMQNGMLSAVTDINATASEITAKVIITAVLFLLSLIVVIITGILLPKLLNKFRNNDVYYVVDGVFGAIIITAILLAALLFVGGVAYTLNDLEFMAKFNGYEAQSVFANAFYKFNPLGSLLENFPLRALFGN